jgi:divalent metal cation (Fe/Co/Zn/Cd) transporter
VVTWMGLGKNFVMTVGKAVVGYSSNSSALIADAAHSASDMVSFMGTPCSICPSSVGARKSGAKLYRTHA